MDAYTYNLYACVCESYCFFQIFKCSECKYFCFQKRVLEVHRRTHLGVKNFACDVCDRKFAAKRFEFNVELLQLFRAVVVIVDEMCM